MGQELDRKRRLLFFRLASIVFFGELAHGMMLYGIIPALVRDRFPQGILLFDLVQVKAELAGACLFCYVLAELLCKLPAGHVVDHGGPDTPLRSGLLLSLVTVPVILLSKYPSVILLGAALHGIGASPIWPAVISAWTRGRSARERAEIMGQILTVWMAGIGLGVILGNFLITLTGRAGMVMAMCVPIALWALTLVAAVWNGSHLGEPAEVESERTDDIVFDFKFPGELRTMAIGLFIQNLAFGAMILPFNFMAFDYLFSEVEGPLRTTLFALMILLGAGPAVLLMGPMGKLADRLGRRKSVIYSMFVVSPLVALAPSISYLPIGAWGRLGSMLPGLLVAGTAYALLLPAWHALALGQISEQQRGRCLALLMSIEMVAMAVGHLIGPALYERVWFGAPFALAGILFGLLAIAYAMGYVLPPESPEEPHQVDLSEPALPGGSTSAKIEKPGRDPLPGHQ